MAGIEPARRRILRGRPPREALARRVHRVWVDPPLAVCPPRRDPLLAALLASGTPVACIFGKSWSLHVKEALGVSLEENLELIHDTRAVLEEARRRGHLRRRALLRWLRRQPRVRASHLGQRSRRRRRRHRPVRHQRRHDAGTIRAAVLPRARVAPRTSPSASTRTTTARWRWPTPWRRGRKGVRHVQGTINGFGERCGNANLISIIPNLQLKLGYQCVPQLGELKSTSRLMFELLNQPPNKRQPYVGDSAFAHKGGDSRIGGRQECPHLRARRPPSR